MGKSRRWAAVCLAVLLSLSVAIAGCGKQGESNKQAGQAGKEGTAQQQTNPAGEQPSSGTRTVSDEFGELEIPVHPQRIAGVYLEDYLVALGITPVVQWYHPNWGKQDYLDLDVPQFDITGSIEALLDASPDLIIVDGVVDAAKYEIYSKIAPTYRLPENILQNPPEILRTIADLVNQKEKGEEVLKQYDQKVADAKEKLKSAIGDETVAVIRLNIGDKTLALFGIENRYAGNIYKEIGLAPPTMVSEMKDFHAVISEEALPELNADHIIVFPSNGYWDSAENKEAEKLFDSPLWKSMPAVKNGHVYQVDRTHWQSGAIYANMKKIDDLLNIFIK